MLLLSVIPLATYGQNSSLNTFSPYTFYGIGDFATQGPGYIRSMGGAGIGFRNSLKINYMNPASYSILRVQCGDGRGQYLFENLGGQDQSQLD